MRTLLLIPIGLASLEQAENKIPHGLGKCFSCCRRHDLLSEHWQRKTFCLGGALQGKMKGETYIFQLSLLLTWENSRQE